MVKCSFASFTLTKCFWSRWNSIWMCCFLVKVNNSDMIFDRLSRQNWWSSFKLVGFLAQTWPLGILHEFPIQLFFIFYFLFLLLQFRNILNSIWICCFDFYWLHFCTYIKVVFVWVWPKEWCIWVLLSQT